MILQKLTPRQTLNKAFLKMKPNRADIDKLKQNLTHLLDQTNDLESEEFHKNLLADFLKNTYYKPNHSINTKGRNDLVIHHGDTPQTTVGVIIEAKKPTNKAEMITTERLNVKAFQELVLYYLRERITLKNLEIKHLIATNLYEWFVFDAQVFDRLFAQDKKMVQQFQDFEAGRLADTKTDFFYKQVAEPFIESLTEEIPFAHFNLKEYEAIARSADTEEDRKLIELFKVLSPEHLLKLPFLNDSNTLDRKFYSELLHIIGLTEIKKEGKKLIIRNEAGKRNAGSILEDAILQLESMGKMKRLESPQQFGENIEERLFHVGMELSITWINRILFLKLLEAQLISYHKGDKEYSFLNIAKIKNYSELNALFFQVLARRQGERSQEIQKVFAKVPYLNSSLFEPTELEHQTIVASNLTPDKTIPVLANTVLKDAQGNKQTGNLPTLAYLFAFLDAYDFGAEGGEEIQEESKTLITASVLGLIFEKINGYKDGSFFTPGFITMYMCRETIRKAVIQKFNEAKNWNCDTIEDLIEYVADFIKKHPKGRKEARKEANQIVNSLKVCDPAVGSGHFLVSALNEIIAIKNDLSILEDRAGESLNFYDVLVVNDELTVLDDTQFFKYFPNNKKSQRVQETLFHEKQTIIENCLFGVDINPNSVKICRLRLWIELLKNAYYLPDSHLTELQTLPNIDINIKCGNSLISRFALDADLSHILKKNDWTIESYQNAVNTYRNAQDKDEKWELERLITKIKADLKKEIGQSSPIIKRIAKLNGEIFALKEQSRLFDLTRAERQEKDKKIKELTQELADVQAEKEWIEKSLAFENTFEWRFEFPEVLNEAGKFMGFDVIIGNPPYIQIQAMKLSQPALETQRYETYEKTGDIYSLFYERGNNILKNEGYLGYITSNKWMRASYGKTTRNYFLAYTQPELLIDLGSGVFDEATVDSNILIFKKQAYQNPFQALDISQEKDIENLNNFSNKTLVISPQQDKSWTISNTMEQNLKTKIESVGKPLKEWDIDIYFGIKTGLNEAFMLDEATKEELIRQDAKSAEIIKPILRGRNIQRYKSDFANVYLIHTHNGDLIEIKDEKDIDFAQKRIFRNNAWETVTNLETTNRKNAYRINRIDATQYPAIYNRLLLFQSELQDRQDKGEHWTNLRNCAYLKDFEKPKVVWKRVGSILRFSYENSDILCLDSTCFIAGEQAKYLTALLNSKVCHYQLHKTAPKTGTGDLLISVQALEPVYIPEPTPEMRTKIENLVDDICAKKQANEDTSALEAEIDHLVYALYDLTEEEIKAVEIV